MRWYISVWHSGRVKTQDSRLKTQEGEGCKKAFRGHPQVEGTSDLGLEMWALKEAGPLGSQTRSDRGGACPSFIASLDSVEGGRVKGRGTGGSKVDEARTH